MADEQLVSQLARRFAVEVKNPSAPTTEVTATATATTDNITKTNHGLSIGDQVTFAGTLAPPLAAATVYYVVAVSTNTFQVSATPGGTKVDISADGSANYTVVADWVRVRAINSLKPTVDNKMEDDSDFDSDGWTSEMKTGMGWALELGLLRKIGVTTKAPDPGQEIIRNAADQFGPASVVEVRWFDRNGGVDAYQGFASASWEPDGGGTTDLDKVSAKLSGQGKRNKITNPYPATP
ncbi:hypothetical protein G7075_04310 [Phycicoccus sp. HDW14]|uniref:phage tail tube protein n=1 Tax=Phycicoccus sp. HDW14 TaxID=2714941 RepID=UPI0014079706|nr:hypothetical protein [Phycicoccus sp. HDW14]QIM20541.1 hypothetical protein G7075_04310 [Phycicoccus sp. HDW14]